MALTSQDIQRFLGQWVVVQLPTGSLEGQVAEVTQTAVRLHPVLAMVKGVVVMDDYSVVTSLRGLVAVRGCSRAVAEEAVAEMQKALAAAQQEAAPLGPRSSWGNPL